MKNKTKDTLDKLSNKTMSWENKFDNEFRAWFIDNNLYQRVKFFIKDIIRDTRSEEAEREDGFIAYCSCGDALERTGLYPNEARYYCIGDDTTYKLVPYYDK